MRDKIAKTIELMYQGYNQQYVADAILALEVEGREIHCPDKGSMMVCMDCENKHDTSKCQRPATIGDLINGGEVS